ncbi:MAG: A/G-specific adenine glycosylase [Patescibacteria group bacterium]
MLEKKEIYLFRRKIWEFYKKNKRDFPWRRTKNAYHILVSEIMLQQTQTERVRAKYKEFLSLFPDINTLAKARVVDVLRAWQGLGYNRRALFLKRTSEILIKEYNGRIPKDEDILKKFPGIGAGTAGALCAFAFNVPSIFIETNIRRVYIHEFFTSKTSVSDKEIFEYIKITIDKKNPREWYYALMDYGVFLGKERTKNPNTKSKHYKKQSRFSGSERQLRGKILKTALLYKKTAPLFISRKTGIDEKNTKRILYTLKSEGFL